MRPGTFSNLFSVFFHCTGGHQPISHWIYESDAIVAKYKALDVPPPFGKKMDFVANPNAHIKPFFHGYSFQQKQQ